MLTTDIIRAAPARFLCEANAIQHVSKFINDCSVLILTGKTAWQVAGSRLNTVLEEANCRMELEYIGRECYQELIKKLTSKAQERNASWIIGVGGGKIMDLSKVVAEYAGIKVATIPTTAATCASWTSLSVIYDSEGKSPIVHELQKNPDLTLVDLDVLKTTPARHLVAGMLDSMAKWYEISSIVDEAGRQKPAIIIALANAKLCRDLLFEFGQHAYECARDNQENELIERVIWINLALPGIPSGLLSEGYKFSIAHAFYNSMTRIMNARFGGYHGEHVAFGIAVQLYLQNINHPELDEFMDFCVKLQAPITLRKLGVEKQDDPQMESVVAGILAEPGIADLPFEVTKDKLWNAIKEIDKRGKYLSQAS